MYSESRFYIDGAWVESTGGRPHPVVNPATEEAVATVTLGTSADVDRAVAAAKAAFPSWSRTSIAERKARLGKLMQVYASHTEELAHTITREMGCPVTLSQRAQAMTGLGHLQAILNGLESVAFEEEIDGVRVTREAIGVCGLITAWNWPIMLIAAKTFAALAAGCTVVLKPSEVAPLNSLYLARIFDEAGMPPGVFNVILGAGEEVGHALSSHPDVDMVSITGSTRAGVQVAQAAAPTVKRVAQELGGKSANIILPDVDITAAVSAGTAHMMMNSGQNCNAPSRMLVPADRAEEAVAAAIATLKGLKVGAPTDPATAIGPVVNRQQWERIQQRIQQGIDEGATLAYGGVGLPEGIERGYYVKPTLFTGVDNQMAIAREEIFGPVLCMLTYGDEDEAVALANDSIYGLTGYVSSSDAAHASRVARRLRAGMIYINYAAPNFNAPFGGFKQSGNGREWGRFGIEEFTELKSIVGFAGD